MTKTVQNVNTDWIVFVTQIKPLLDKIVLKVKKKFLIFCYIYYGHKFSF